MARKTWTDYAGTVDGIIFMVDVAATERMNEVKAELDQLMSMPELQNIPFVVFGNKIDLPGALNEEQLRETLGLEFHKTAGKGAQKNPGTRPVEVFMCSVMKRVGYSDGFAWLSSYIK